MTGLSPTARAVTTRPETIVYMTSCEETRLILSLSPAPYADETIATTATPIAANMLPISQFTVVVRLTDAVAAAPSRPTMAVSTY